MDVTTSGRCSTSAMAPDFFAAPLEYDPKARFLTMVVGQVCEVRR